MKITWFLQTPLFITNSKIWGHGDQRTKTNWVITMNPRIIYSKSDQFYFYFVTQACQTTPELRQIVFTFQLQFWPSPCDSETTRATISHETSETCNSSGLQLSENWRNQEKLPWTPFWEFGKGQRKDRPVQWPNRVLYVTSENSPHSNHWNTAEGPARM